MTQEIVKTKLIITSAERKSNEVVVQKNDYDIIRSACTHENILLYFQVSDNDQGLKECCYHVATACNREVIFFYTRDLVTLESRH